MKTLTKLSIAVLAASLQLACGGGDGESDVVVEESVTPLNQLRPGERFAMETPLLSGGSQINHYMVHGVTPEGELVESDRPDLLQSARIPILEYVTRDGRSSTSVANPTTLKQQQQAFYQQLWNATAEHEGTRDPQVILAEIDDLDTRIVDLMDDVGASGVTLKEYIAFYDRPDAIPELADKELAELNLREALSDVNSASVLKADSPVCPAGLIRVVSQSGLLTYCRLPPKRMMSLANQPTVASSAITASPDEPSLRGVIDAENIDNLLVTMVKTQLERLDAQRQALLMEIQVEQKWAEQLQDALRKNGQDDQQWRTYCAQHSELLCVSSDTPNFGAVMSQRTQGMLESINVSLPLKVLQLQNLLSKFNSTTELNSTLLNNIVDGRLAVITSML